MNVKPASATGFRNGQIHSPICHHQGLFLCNLIYLLLVYFTFVCFISNLIIIQVMLKKLWMCLLESHRFNQKLTHLYSIPILGNPIMGIMFCVVNESFSALLSLYILGFWVSIWSQWRKLWFFEVNWPALVQIELLVQFLCTVHTEENSEKFTIDCPYYFRIFNKISVFWVWWFLEAFWVCREQ